MTIVTGDRWTGPVVALLLAAAAPGCSSEGTADPSLPTTVPPSAAPDASAAAGTSPVAATTLPPGLEPDDPAADNRPPTQDEIDTSTGYPRVCLMLSLDEISAATGATAVSSHEGEFGGATTCFVEDAAGEKVMTLVAGPAARYEVAIAAVGARSVDGLGDGAVWTEGVLHVLMGDEDLAFELRPAAGVPADAAESVLEQIAGGTVSRYQPPPTDG